MKDNTSEIKQDFTLLRKLISEEISKSPNICCNHCCEPNNSKMPHTTTMRCQTIGNENTKIINLNCEPVPVPICFFKCCQSSNPSSSLPTTELRPESARQEMITTDVQCQTECFTPAKESYASIISYARPVPDCFQEINVPLQEPYVSSNVCPQKVCALCCCPVEDQINYCRENFQNVTVRNPSQKSFNICTENATASCWNHEIPLVATQCMCSPPYKRTSWEKDYGPKPSEVAPKIHMRSTHGILLKSQSTQVGTIEVLDDNRFTINGIPFKSCECGEKAEGKFTIAETVKQPPNKEIESASDRPGSSTSESSTDSQTSRGRRLKSRDWLTKTAEGSTLRKSKKLRSKKEKKTKQQGTFTLWIDSMYFPSRTMERLNAMDSKPYVYLTWTFLELEDKAYSTIMPANKAVFNCSSVYRGDITLEMLHYMCANKVKVECHVALNDSSKMISFGEIDVSEAIYKPNTKCKYKVSLDGPNNMSAVLTSRFKFDCPENLLRRVLQK